MGYRLLADAAMVVHFGSLVYVVAGGFLAWRWPTPIWPHLALVRWGHRRVSPRLPLTYLEDAACPAASSIIT